MESCEFLPMDSRMVLKICKCCRCKYEWAARFGTPARCAQSRCRSPYWNRPRLAELAAKRQADGTIDPASRCYRCIRVGRREPCRDCPGYKPPFDPTGRCDTCIKFQFTHPCRQCPNYDPALDPWADSAVWCPRCSRIRSVNPCSSCPVNQVKTIAAPFDPTGRCNGCIRTTATQPCRWCPCWEAQLGKPTIHGKSAGAENVG